MDDMTSVSPPAPTAAGRRKGKSATKDELMARIKQLEQDHTALALTRCVER